MATQQHTDVRDARPADGAAILYILGKLAAFEGCARTPGLDENLLRRDVFGANPRLNILVAEGSGGLEGLITTCANYSSWEGAAGCHIGDLWVDPVARGKGVGAALIRSVVTRCQGQGGRRVDAHVLHANEARGFYETLGFRQLSEWCIYRKELPAATRCSLPTAGLANTSDRSLVRGRLHGKRFVATENAGGISNSQTIFEYSVAGDAITGTYRGGSILTGNIVGRALSDRTIALLFQCIADDMRILAGESVGTIGIDEAGLTTLEFEWAWLSGDRSRRRSSYVEIA